MGDREQWEKLCRVLTEVQIATDNAVIEMMFLETLRAIRDRLRQFDFIYVVPARVSLAQVLGLVRRFLATRSGGDRGLALAAAFFETLRERLGIYTEIRRSVINAADAATKAVGDLECIALDGNVSLAVEVKERQIADADVHLTVAKAREFGVQEIIFCCPGIVRNSEANVARTFAAAWASGTSLYQVSLTELITNVMPILGEQAVRQFVVSVGKQLDAFSSQPIHRREWKSLLDAL